MFKSWKLDLADAYGHTRLDLFLVGLLWLRLLNNDIEELTKKDCSFEEMYAKVKSLKGSFEYANNFQLISKLLDLEKHPELKFVEVIEDFDQWIINVVKTQEEMEVSEMNNLGLKKPNNLNIQSQENEVSQEETTVEVHETIQEDVYEEIEQPETIKGTTYVEYEQLNNGENNIQSTQETNKVVTEQYTNINEGADDQNLHETNDNMNDNLNDDNVRERNKDNVQVTITNTTQQTQLTNVQYEDQPGHQISAQNDLEINPKNTPKQGPIHSFVEGSFVNKSKLLIIRFD
jgi:hypothetical protein